MVESANKTLPTQFEWRWRTSDGTECCGGEADLLDAIHKGDLDETCRVQHAAAPEWQIARDVPVLYAALSARASTPSIPLAAAVPPSVPHMPQRKATVSQPRLKLRLSEHASSGRMTSETPVPMDPSSLRSFAFERNRSSVPSATPITIKPPGAVPPPPRRAHRVRSLTPSASPAAQLASPSTPAPETPTPRADSGAPMALSPVSQAGDSKNSAAIPTAFSSDVETAADAPASIDEDQPNLATPPLETAAETETAPEVLELPRSAASLSESWRGLVKRADRKVLLTGAGVSMLLLIASLATLTKRGNGPSRDAAQPARSQTSHAKPQVVGPTALPVTPSSCTLAQPAARISQTLERSVPFFGLRSAPNQLALGFASHKQHAVGLNIDAANLDNSTTFEADGNHAVRGTVPFLKQSELRFNVDREGGVLRFARSASHDAGFALGILDGKLARYSEGGNALPLFDEAITLASEPRWVHVEGRGYAVTFKPANLESKVALAYLDEQGQPLKPLMFIESATAQRGNPTLAANSRGEVIVAFAGKGSGTTPWQIFTAKTSFGESTNASEWSHHLGPGDAIAPSLAALTNGDWLLQYTEGLPGRNQVRVQRTDANLNPTGNSILVSPKGTHAGQGIVVATEKYAVSFYILNVGGRDELWATSLECDH